MKLSFYLTLISVLPIASFSTEDVRTILVQDEADSPLDPYTIFKSEKVPKEKLERPQYQSVAELLQNQTGVEAQTYCSNCGAKRLTINGLKGEHTSLLIDGLPLHSAVSSFYGVDSIPVNGISDIEVMRGAGASLTNPEAIGGTINIVTVDPLVSKKIINTSSSFNDELSRTAQNHSVLLSLPGRSKKFGFVLGGQFTDLKAWDEDENGVAESPYRDNISAMTKVRLLPNEKNDISFRLGMSDMTNLGGAVNASKPADVRSTPADSSDFEDANVEKKYLGDPSKITDWISLKRYESTFHWTHFLSEQTTVNLKSGYARQEQSSIYQHGFDYAHNDNLFVTDLNLKTLLGDSHIVTAGVFHKTQRLRSASAVLFQERSIPNDNFDSQSNAAYLSYNFLYNDLFEVDLALRFDQIKVDWLSLDNEIGSDVLAPRIQIKHNFTDHLSQRLSYGLGYRAPLTFFESQHGNNENGYQVDINRLEKADSIVYSLSYNTPAYYATLGTHYTYLQNMAYGVESAEDPIYYRNSNESYEIWAHDILLGYQVTPWWMLEASLEFFEYENTYTMKLPTAAIEERYQLKSSITYKKWTHGLTATLVGSRNLSRYQDYSDHYVDRNQTRFPEVQGEEKKDQTAPSFVLIDTNIDYSFNKNYSLSFGIINLLDITQTGEGDSPSTWHWHFTHAHYDGLHTWGPNRGREYLLKLTAQF